MTKGKAPARPPKQSGGPLRVRPVCFQTQRLKDQARSKRSRFITFTQAFTNSATNFAFASSEA